MYFHAHFSMLHINVWPLTMSVLTMSGHPRDTMGSHHSWWGLYECSPTATFHWESVELSQRGILPQLSCSNFSEDTLHHQTEIPTSKLFLEKRVSFQWIFLEKIRAAITYFLITFSARKLRSLFYSITLHNCSSSPPSLYGFCFLPWLNGFTSLKTYVLL